MNSCDINPWDDIGPKGLAGKEFLLCAPFSVIFNTLVLVLARKYIYLKERLDQWFVINMTLANLGFGLISIVTPYSFNLPQWLCRPYYIIIWTVTAASMMFLLLLNIQKFITLFLPYKSKQMISKNTTIIQIAFVWIIVITYSVISALKLTFNTSDPCYECDVKAEPYLYACMVLMFYVCPLITSLVISICIFALAQRKTKTPTGSRIEEGHKHFKRIFFVFSYTAFNAVAFLPFRITYSIYIFCVFNYELKKVTQVTYHFMDPVELLTNVHEDLEDNRCIYKELTYSFLCLLPFGTVINPLLTILTQRSYRNGVKECFSFVKCTSKWKYKSQRTVEIKHNNIEKISSV